MPDTTWPVSGYPPGSSRSRRNTPVSMSSKRFGTSATIRSRSPSQSPPDASAGAFSSSLTTTVFSQRSMRRLEASLRRATPKGHETFISRTAPHQGLAPTSGPPCVQDTPRHAQPPRSTGTGPARAAPAGQDDRRAASSRPAGPSAVRVSGRSSSAATAAMASPARPTTGAWSCSASSAPPWLPGPRPSTPAPPPAPAAQRPPPAAPPARLPAPKHRDLRVPLSH